MLEASVRGIRDMQGLVITETADRLSGADYTLTNLRDCEVHLRGKMGALRISNVSNCVIFAGPVSGATFLDGATLHIFLP